MHDRHWIEAEVVARLTDGIEPDTVRRVLVQCLAGELSPQVALMRMVCETESVTLVRAAVDEVTERAATSSRAGDNLVRDRVDDLTELFVENEAGCSRVADMLRTAMDSSVPTPTAQEGVAFAERLFDWSARQGEQGGEQASEQASIALSSVGSPEAIEQATQEIVAQFDRWGLLGRRAKVLQIGCGIGRFELALAPRVGEAHGIDISAEMVKVAERRCEALPNVFLQKTSGQDLAMFDDASFDLVYAVDSFPYLVQAGMPLVERHFAEVRRVLKAGGHFVILNFSYRNGLTEDDATVRALAAANGFEMVQSGVRPFTLWDGVAWVMTTSGGRRAARAD
jgi:SAM-dependent methyltransferase